VPSPDLVVNLVAPVNLIIVRKAELTFAEIEAELAAWRELSNQRVLTVDASRSISEIVDEIESRLDL
jgi:thymidylate kinase